MEDSLKNCQSLGWDTRAFCQAQEGWNGTSYLHSTNHLSPWGKLAQPKIQKFTRASSGGAPTGDVASSP